MSDSQLMEGNDSDVDENVPSSKKNTDNSDKNKSIDSPSQQDGNGEATSTDDTQQIQNNNNTPVNTQDAPIPPPNDNTGPINNETFTIRLPSTNMVLIFSAILVLIVSILISSYKFSSPEACDMRKAENRDFNKYYGIVNLKNHFTTPSADECDSKIIFRPALPQTILKPDHSASSFLTLAPYGTGKTVLRCEYFKSLRSDSYFKILILNKQLSEYLERFVKEKTKNGIDCEKENCLQEWSKNEFGQLLLSLLVTQFIQTFEKERFDLPDIPLDEKIELITIICYYYNEQGVDKLEKFVNSLFMKTANSTYHINQIEGQIKEQNSMVNKPLFTHLKKDLKELRALRQNDEKLLLLLGIIEGENYTIKATETTMSDNVFNALRHFALFMKTHIQKTAVFIIDGIDENRFFFQDYKVNKKSLELFYRSSLSQETIAMVMAHNFYLSIFYPKIDGINMQDSIIRRDKFPILTINWNTKSLINYADYVLQELNKNTSASRCKPFIDFKTLVNYANRENAEIINQIRTPRALHFFMSKLITEMNDCANDGHVPFIATFENVHVAHQSSPDSSYKDRFTQEQNE